MPCEKTQHLRASKDILKFDGDLCTALRDVLLHKLQMAGALSSFEEPLRYGYFWNQGVKLHHIGGCHFDSGLVTSLGPPLAAVHLRTGGKNRMGKKETCCFGEKEAILCSQKTSPPCKAKMGKERAIEEVVMTRSAPRHFGSARHPSRRREKTHHSSSGRERRNRPKKSYLSE